MPVTCRGGQAPQCKNDNSAKDDYESAHDIIGTRAVNFSKILLQLNPAHPIVAARS
jgi:hypothetical protein